jgi:ribose-phosphate pyrophosphokinase
MIKLNGKEVKQGRFPDGTLALNIDSSLVDDLMFEQHITWLYDGDDEMFTIMSLVDMIKRNGYSRYILYMPYLPNARMDRIKSNNENFALKVFCNWLNSLGFVKVYVENVHSNVSNALIDNIVDELPDMDIETIERLYKFDVIFFPDEGACKRYKDMDVIKELGLPIAFGIKNRDWKTGEILNLDVMGADVKGKKVLIIDDICSKGFTFYYSGMKLRELGASDVRLYVTHCEGTIRSGKILDTDVISKVYTTDSICHYDGDKIEFVRKFRN